MHRHILSTRNTATLRLNSPPNTTAALQPLDHGVIYTMKCSYRKRFISRTVSLIDDGGSASQIAKTVTILDAVMWVADAVKAISSSTVRCCFAKCGFFNQDSSLSETADKNGARDLTLALSAMPGPTAEAEEFVTFDDDICVHEFLDSNWEEDIIAEVDYEGGFQSPREESEEEETPLISWKEC